MTAGVNEPGGLAFKAYEIEELVDIYFFRRLGIVCAWAARAIRLTPNTVSILSGIVGAIGGALLVSDRDAWLGIALIFAYGVLDSTDGQLARLTGQTSEWGRVLDGVSGYVMHVAAYLAIVIRVIDRGGSPWIIGGALLAGAMTVAHAQLYDYHRTSYTSIVVKGRASVSAPGTRQPNVVVRLYERAQRALAGLHPQVEAAIAARATGGMVSEADRRRYRERFIRLMPGWNLFGDNMRRFGLLALVALGHLEWFFAFIVAMNVPLLVVWNWQRAADARFLAEESEGQKRDNAITQ